MINIFKKYYGAMEVSAPPVLSDFVIPECLGKWVFSKLD